MHAPHDPNNLMDMLEIPEPFEKASAVRKHDKMVTASFPIPTIDSPQIHLNTTKSLHKTNFVTVLSK